MEHLLPLNITPPLQIRAYFEQLDDVDSNTAIPADRPDCELLFSTILERYQTPGLVAPIDSHTERSLWLEQCSGGRVYDLCWVLQSHLFFGTTVQILPRVVVTDFMDQSGDDGTTLLTTQQLPEYLLAWKEEVSAMYPEAQLRLREKAKLVLEHSALILRHLARFLEDSYSDEATVERGWTADDEPLGSTHLACVLLQKALLNACERVLGLEVGNDSPLVPGLTAPWLRWKMAEEGWCPFVLERLFDTCDVEEAAYALCIGTTRAESNQHDSCSRQCCRAEHDHSETQLPHISSLCDCRVIEAPLQDIRANWSRGKVPVLRIGTNDDYKLSLSAHDAGDENEYIAVAHLPGDNIACARSNVIAQCQLIRLGIRVYGLGPRRGRGMCIWMEELCMPFASSHQLGLSVSDDQLAVIYQRASAMMIIDADMWEMRLPPSMSELGMRLHLWTIQWRRFKDGVLNKRLLVMTSIGIIDVSKLLLDTSNTAVKDHSLAHDLEQKMMRKTAALMGIEDRLLSSAQKLRNMGREAT